MRFNLIHLYQHHPSSLRNDATVAILISLRTGHFVDYQSPFVSSSLCTVACPQNTPQECHSEYATVTPIMGTYCIGQLFSSILLLYNMRHLRKQFNEYKLIKRVTVLIIMAPTLFVVIDAATGPEHGALRRRMEIALSIFITGMMFWSPCAQPVWAFIVKDEVSVVAIRVWPREMDFHDYFVSAHVQQQQRSSQTVRSPESFS